MKPSNTIIRKLSKIFRIQMVSLCLTIGTLTITNAAGGVSCTSKNGNAEIWISMGRVPIYAPTAASAKYGDQNWSSNPQDGEIELGESQGMIEDDRFSADFVDTNAEKIIISLRVDYSDEESEEGYPGTLKFLDGISHPVFCMFE